MPKAWPVKPASAHTVRELLVRNVRRTSEGAPAPSIELIPEDVGKFVVQLLSVSAAAQAATGSPLGRRIARNGAAVEPSAIGRGQSPRKGHEILVVRCGNAEFGLSIPHAKLRQIGTAMIAATASGAEN